MRTLLTGLAWAVGAAGVTVLTYLLILGWNAKMHLVAEEPGSVGTECAGPYEPGQVVLLGVVLAALVVLGAWTRHEYVVPLVTVVTLTALFTVDALTVDDPCADTTLLGVGVFMVLVGSGAAAAVLALATVSIRNRWDRDSGARQSPK